MKLSARVLPVLVCLFSALCLCGCSNGSNGTDLSGSTLVSSSTTEYRWYTGGEKSGDCYRLIFEKGDAWKLVFASASESAEQAAGTYTVSGNSIQFKILSNSSTLITGTDDFTGTKSGNTITISGKPFVRT